MKSNLTLIVGLLLILILPATLRAQFTYTTNNSAITITGYTGPGGAVTIPNTITGLPVTAIGANAFRNITSLTSVTIPTSVVDIASQAFYGCGGLTALTLGTGLTNIGDAAFQLCSSLTSFTIPSGVISIGNYAFSQCTHLASILIPSNVAIIGYAPFQSCSSLTAITVDTLNSAYSSLDGVLLDKMQTKLIQYPEGKPDSHYTVPTTVLHIEFRAFNACANLTSVTIAESTSNIGSFAFAACQNLTNIIMGTSLTDVGTYAFYWCTSLGSVAIPSGVTNIGDGAFYACTSLTNITLPNSVTTIGVAAFYYCISLATTTIPSSLISIGNYAWYDCYGLTSVFFQGDVPAAGESIFAADNNATVYYMPGTVGWGSSYGGRPALPWVRPTPVILSFGPSFGVQTNGFGFVISWATNIPVVVEATANIANPTWIALQTNTLTGGSWCFNDLQWTNYPARFYRVRSL